MNKTISRVALSAGVRRFAAAALGCSALLLAPALSLAGEPLPTTPDQLTFPLLEFEQELPEPQELSNGVQLYMLQDPSWGTVTLFGYFDVGSIHEPADKTGLAGAVGSLMLDGGVGERTGDELAAFLEERAIQASASAGDDFFSFSVDALPGELDDALGVLRDMMTAPRFGELELARWRRQEIEGLRRRNDSPEGIARREFSFLVQGKDNPWARQPAPEDVMSISREDLLKFHGDFIRPNRARLGVVGDFDPETMPARLEKLFEGWKPNDVEKPAVEPIAEPEPGAYYVDKPGQPNAQILIGHLGLRRKDPDQLAAEAINELYGSGFSSRLMREVRDNRGLSYGAGGRLGWADDRGVFMNTAATQTPRAAEAVKVIVDEIGKLATGPILEDELTRAVDSMSNSFVFRYATPDTVANWAIMLDMRGYPDDYLSTYLSRLRALTPEKVAEAAHRHVHPDKLVILLVGDASKFRDAMAALGYDDMTEIVPEDYSGFEMPEDETEDLAGEGRPVVPVTVPAGE